MREEIRRWENSEKYKQIKAQLDEKLRTWSGIEYLTNMEYDKHKKMTIKELEIQYKLIVESEDFLPSELNRSIIHSEPDVIYRKYCSQQASWHFQLFSFMIDEQYEQCATIRDIINYLEEELIHLIKNIRQDIDHDIIKYICKVNISYAEKVYNKFEKYNVKRNNIK